MRARTCRRALDALIATTSSGAQFSGPVVLRNLHRHLAAGPAVLGQTWSVTVFSEPGCATFDHTSRLGIGLARLPQPLALPGFGNLWLDLAAPFTLADAVVPAITGQVTYPLPPPAAPVLAGLPLHLQALLEQAPAAARLTDFVSVVLQ